MYIQTYETHISKLNDTEYLLRIPSKLSKLLNSNYINHVLTCEFEYYLSTDTPDDLTGIIDVRATKKHIYRKNKTTYITIPSIYAKLLNIDVEVAFLELYIADSKKIIGVTKAPSIDASLANNSKASEIVGTYEATIKDGNFITLPIDLYNFLDKPSKLYYLQSNDKNNISTLIPANSKGYVKNSIALNKKTRKVVFNKTLKSLVEKKNIRHIYLNLIQTHNNKRYVTIDLNKPVVNNNNDNIGNMPRLLKHYVVNPPNETKNMKYELKGEYVVKLSGNKNYISLELPEEVLGQFDYPSALFHVKSFNRPAKYYLCENIPPWPYITLQSFDISQIEPKKYSILIPKAYHDNKSIKKDNYCKIKLYENSSMKYLELEFPAKEKYLKEIDRSQSTLDGYF